jgi:hypothetical protein
MNCCTRWPALFRDELQLELLTDGSRREQRPLQRRGAPVLIAGVIVRGLAHSNTNLKRCIRGLVSNLASAHMLRYTNKTLLKT